MLLAESTRLLSLLSGVWTKVSSLFSPESTGTPFFSLEKRGARSLSKKGKSFTAFCSTLFQVFDVASLDRLSLSRRSERDGDRFGSPRRPRNSKADEGRPDTFLAKYAIQIPWKNEGGIHAQKRTAVWVFSGLQRHHIHG